MTPTPVHKLQQAFRRLQHAYLREDGEGELVEWARKEVPETFQDYQQAWKEVQQFWDEHRDQPPIEMAEEIDDPQGVEFLLQEWASVQPNNEQIIELLENGRIGGQYWRPILKGIGRPDTDLIEAAFDNTLEWNALAENPNLEAPHIRRLVELCVELMVDFERSKRAGTYRGRRHYQERRLRGNAEKMVIQILEDPNHEELLPRKAIEALLDAATDVEDALKNGLKRYSPDQAHDPGHGQADGVLETIWNETRGLKKKDLFRVLQSYRDNHWAGRGLIEEFGDDLTRQEWVELAKYCGDYKARKMMAAHPRARQIPEVRTYLNESQGFEVQAGLMQSAQGEELQQRLKQMLGRDIDKTLDWLREHELEYPEDVTVDVFLEHIQQEDREQRLRTIMAAAQVSGPKTKEPPQKKGRGR